jgi:hypothetical protein
MYFSLARLENYAQSERLALRLQEEGSRPEKTVYQILKGSDTFSLLNLPMVLKVRSAK